MVWDAEVRAREREMTVLAELINKTWARSRSAGGRAEASQGRAAEWDLWGCKSRPT